ncbi:NfeD family protein [Hansschlegelia quercus]|uniref:NfeD family protein n=1 Tax=Hansschlegelia quercus TaxID=2528245 RepID=UPI00197A9AC6|nr:NfeD family protein [Hansschlegelia quercus]
MIESLLVALGPWRWFVFGLVLLGVELVAPGTVLLWLGIAAIIVGLVALLFDPGWQVEVVGFAVLALAAAVLWWRIGRPDNAATSDRPMLNRRAERHIGRVFVLDAPIVNGEGRLRVDDTVWRMTGPDLMAGARVRVVAADGSTLQVAAEA